MYMYNKIEWLIAEIIFRSIIIMLAKEAFKSYSHVYLNGVHISGCNWLR